jgi:hypothetical protein
MTVPELHYWGKLKTNHTRRNRHIITQVFQLAEQPT